jgi:hypothetical protein
MAGLDGKHVFLSASFPSGDRGRSFEPYDSGAIAAAVTSVVRAVFSAGGCLVFGGHPTITPLVLFVASEHQRQHSVDVFQSRWFEAIVPPETKRLVDLGWGELHWVDARDDRESSLRLMRETMFSETNPAAGVFVGGMEGIEAEWDLFEDLAPGRPRFALRAPGGGAAGLVLDSRDEALQALLASEHYPAVAYRIVDRIAAQTSDPSASDTGG